MLVCSLRIANYELTCKRNACLKITIIWRNILPVSKIVVAPHLIHSTNFTASERNNFLRMSNAVSIKRIPSLEDSLAISRCILCTIVCVCATTVHWWPGPAPWLLDSCWLIRSHLWTIIQIVQGDLWTTSQSFSSCWISRPELLLRKLYVST